MSREIEPITDHAAYIARLREVWDDGLSTIMSGFAGHETLRPLEGSEFDQEIPAGAQNPYWEAVRLLPLSTWSSNFYPSQVEIDGYCSPVDYGKYPDVIAPRWRLTKTFAWAIPTPGDIAWMVGYLGGRGVVDFGAGTGYWAWQLAQAGVDVLAFDKEPGGNHYCAPTPFHDVRRGQVDTLLILDHDRDALFLSWPPYKDPFGADLLRAYRGDMLFYAGEPDGGCCADDDFFELLDKEWEEAAGSPSHATYSGIHCYLKMYRRR